MNILQKIFTDYYEEMIYTLHPRHSVVENVDKMIHCGDPAFGGAMYGCPHCGNMKFVPFRCHMFSVKHFSLKKASKFPVFVKGFSLLSAGTDYASLRIRACSIR